MTWYRGDGIYQDIIVSSRVRLARNLEAYKFPNSIDDEEKNKLVLDVKNAVGNLDEDYLFYSLSDLEDLSVNNLLDENIITKELVENKNISSVFISNDEKKTIMLNEEDHIRMQYMTAGFDLDKCFKEVNKLDDELEKTLDYAFDEKYGYLTACPTNIGTGLRASVMIHIPALTLTGYLKNMVQGLNKLGVTVRGLYGEGSRGYGYFYQVSNQMTLGENEAKIMDKFKGIVIQIINKEEELRKRIYDEKKYDVEDRIYRSLGILKNARMISTKESLEHISNIRLGVELEIFKNLIYEDIMYLMIQIQPSILQKAEDKELTKDERDIKRASILRDFLNEEG